MAPARSSSVDLGKVMIPSPPRGGLEQEDVMGKPVWLKLKLNYVNDQSDWIMCMGELCGYTPGGVRGDRKLEVFVKYLDNTLVIDPKYLEDMMDAKGIEDLDATRAQLLVKEVPPDAECLGLDIKGYLIPEILMQRLAAWEGRTVAGGRRLNDSQLKEVKKNLASLVRKHSAGYVKGELWPSWPAEAELGIDKQVRGRDDDHQRENLAPRTRSRSRSHSLARAMKEEDDLRSKLDRDTALDGDTEEMTGEGIVEAYMTAVNSGQTQKEAIDAIQMIFEVDMQTIGSTMRTYIRKNCGKQNEQVEVAIKILKGMSEQQSARSAREDGAYHEARAEQPKPQEKRNPSTPDKLFPAHYGEKKEEGSLIRPAEETGKYNPLTANDSIVGQLFGMGGRVEEVSTRAGAGGDEEETHMSARVVHALEGIRKATEGDKKGNPGTRSAIGSEESLDVYLARGCNTLTVEVCPDVTGKELFDALKRACSHAKAKLQQIEWPCLVTNGIAYGLAAMQHGGKDHSTLAPWQLSVAHAVTAKPRDFDQYEAPKDDKIEPKPRYPTHFATWLKQARNEIKMIGSVIGLEHKKERIKALEQIEKAHEQDSDVWPESYCYSLWEELKAAWVEELRESRRQLCRILNTDNPRKEDLKFVALAPDSGFHFPRTFDLAHPEGYYQQVCVPRQARALKGIIYGQLHHKRQAPKVGGDHAPGEGEPHGGEAGGEEDRVGRGRERGNDKNDKKKREKEKDERKAYPAGKRLRPREAAESVKHGPRTKEGKPICWDGATHMGCSRGKDCNHAHQPINTTKGLHWTVLAQLIRRGGLKNGPMIQPAQVDGRIAQLRAQAKAEQDEKVKDGAGQKQGWLPPEEYEDIQYTQLEDELRELTRGPDADWLKDPSSRPGAEPHTVWSRRVEHPEAQKRLRILEELEKGGAFARLAGWSSYLQSHVRGRMLNAIIEKQEMTIDEVLLEATEKGCPELAQEAEKVLGEERSVGWVDEERQAWVSPTVWHKEKGYGEGKFEFQCGPERRCWRYLDYKDRLPVPDELASALGLQPGDEEERQCLVLHPAAGILLWGGDWDPERVPSLEEVRLKAQSFRAGLWDEAAKAIGELGDPAPWIGAREAEVRGFAHDCLRAHHDKDYRLFQAFVLEELKEVTLQCWRLNCRGQVHVDHLVGSAPGSENNIIPFLIHGGHIRLLVPIEKEEPVKVAAELTLSGQSDREWPCEGWREFLANEDPAAPLVYPARLCKGWALVVQAAYAGWDTIQVAQALEVIQESDGREGEIPHKAAGANRHQHAGQSDPSHQAAPSHSTAAFSLSERCGSAEIDEFQEGFGLLRGHHCGSIGEGEFSHGIPIPEDPLEPEGEEEEEEGATSDEDRRMNPRDEARVMARLVPREVSPGDVAEPVRPYEGNINIFGPPRPLEGLDGRSEDWWDLQEDNLFLVRHHVMPRTHLFGSHYVDWTDCPVSDHLIRSDRRTWMYPQRRELSEIAPHERVFLDNWRVDLARLRDIPDSIDAEYADWTGATTFYLYDPLIRPELGPHFERGQEEGGEPDSPAPEPESELRPTYPEGRDYQPVFHPPREFPVPTREQVADARRYYPGGGVWDPWNGGRIEGDDAEQAEEQPGSSSDRRRRSRSRSRGRGPDADDGAEERRVGYLSASCILEAEETEGNRWMMRETIEDEYHVGAPVYSEKGQSVKEEVLDKALCYVHHCREHPKYEPNVIKQAVELGDDLLRTAGTLEEAMRGLRAARRQVIGVPTIGATSEEVLRCLESDHAQYLKAANRDGVRTRRYYPARRLKAEPYPSAIEHLEEMYQKAWKDGHWGIVLFASDATEDCTSNLIECPQGRVPKQLPDRSISAEGRPIHAMMTANAATHKYQHPPAVQPRHRQIARKAIWWKARNPGIRCLIAKLDVSRAFKWHDVAPEDTADFGSALPGELVGVEGRVKLVYGGLPFGWCGAPGEYMAFALAGRAYHESFKPEMEGVNGPTPFSSEWLMDDSVIVEPLMGVRPWQAVDALGHSIEKIWGKAALNLDKQIEEGTPASEQIVWGLYMNVENMTIRLPEPKALKMRYLLALPELQYGVRQVRLKVAQELRGLSNRDQCEAAIEGSSLKGTECLQSEEDLTWVFASIAEDSWGGTRSYVRQFVKEHRPSNALIDLAREGPVREMQADFKKLGYVVNVNEYLTTHFGDPVAKRKFVLVAHRGSLANDATFPDEAPRSAAEPASIKRALDSAAGAVRQEWLASDVEVTLNNKISTSGDRMLPWPAGHYKEGDKKELPYDIRGPALTCRKGRSMVVLDHRGEAVQARAISAEEEWLLNGGRLEELHLLREAGAKVNFFKKDAAMKFPQQSAHHLLSWYERWRQGISEGPEAGGRVGVCRDPDRVHADEQVRAWMRAWQGDNHNPRANYERWLAAKKADLEGDQKVGGRRQTTKRAKSGPPDRLVLPSAIGRGRERLQLDANRELRRDQAWLDALAAEAVMSKLSEGTRAGYEVGWKQWCLWRRMGRKDVYLTGESKEDRKIDEDELLRFMTYLAHVMGRTEGTIKQRLFAIKMGHLVAGHEDPTLHKVRIWAALNGYKRWQPETKRKYPVLPAMLLWIKKHLSTSETLSRVDQAILWAAIMVGFFFLLRASEFLVTMGRSWGTSRTLKGNDIEARRDNLQVMNFHQAEEIVIYLKGSQTDQYNQGTVRNQFRSGDELCVVTALANYQAMKPERFAGAEADQPLFRLENGKPLQRTDIQGLIQLAAVADGQSTTRYGSHSLRIGGATAMYQTTKDLDIVKRFGRWNSDAFHGYLEQMEKIGYDGTMQALGSPGDEERRMHGYNVQKMTVKSSKVHKVACFPMTQ
eukprot:g6489.t1